MGIGRGSLTSPQFLDAQDIVGVIAAVLRIVADAWDRVFQEGVLLAWAMSLTFVWNASESARRRKMIRKALPDN